MFVVGSFNALKMLYVGVMWPLVYLNCMQCPYMVATFAWNSNGKVCCQCYMGCVYILTPAPHQHRMLEWCDHLLIYIKCCVLIWEPHVDGMVIARSVVSATWDVCTHTSTTPALHLASLWHWLSSLVAPRTLLAAQTQSHWCWASPLALNPHCSQGECWWATAEWALSDLEGSPLAVTLSCPLVISSDYMHFNLCGV